MIGQTVAHYRINAELGRGGMGVVYRAHDERLLRSVAIKILSDVSRGSGETRSGMLAEARAAFNLILARAVADRRLPVRLPSPETPVRAARAASSCSTVFAARSLSLRNCWTTPAKLAIAPPAPGIVSGY